MEKLRLLQELGVDVNNGIIPLTGEICEEMYARLVHCLSAMNNAGIGYDEITILLNTPGGDVYQAFAIIDLLNAQKLQGIKIRVVCNGPVMSAGTLILMCADTREMTPSSHLMIHYGEDNGTSCDNDLKHTIHLRGMMKDLYMNNSYVTPKVILNWFSTNVYYNPSQALKMGLIDRICDEPKKPKRKKKSAARSRG